MKKSKTPSFQLELQLLVNPGQARSLRAYFEAARVLYNALLGEALKRLHRLRTDPAWQAARALLRTQKRERAAAFSRLREQHGFSEFALHAFSKEANCSWISEHIDSTMAQTLASDSSNAACEGQVLPRSVGITYAGARLPKSLTTSQQELVYRRGRLEALE